MSAVFTSHRVKEGVSRQVKRLIWHDKQQKHLCICHISNLSYGHRQFLEKKDYSLLLFVTI